MATAMTQPVQWFANPLSCSAESTPERQQPQFSSFRLSPFLGPAHLGQQQPWLTAPNARQAGCSAWQASQDSQLSSPLSVGVNAGVGNVATMYTPSPAQCASIAQLQPQFTHHENELYESSTDKQLLHMDEMQQNISTLKACLEREQDLRSKLQLRLVGANSTIKALRERALHSRMDAGLPPEELQYRQQLFNHQQHLIQLQETVGAAKKQLLQAEHEGTYQLRMTQEEHLSDADTLRPRKLLCSPGTSSAGCSPCPPMCHSKRPHRLVTTSNQYGCEQMPPKELISPSTDVPGDLSQRVTSHFSLAPYLGTQSILSPVAAGQVMVFPQPVMVPSRASDNSPLRSTFHPFATAGQSAAADISGSVCPASKHGEQPTHAGIACVQPAGSHRGSPLPAARHTPQRNIINDTGMAQSGAMQQQRSAGARSAATALHHSWQGDGDVGPLGRQVWRLLQLRSSTGGPSPSSDPCNYSHPGGSLQADGRRLGTHCQPQDSACLAASTVQHGVSGMQDQNSLVSRLMSHFANGHGTEVPDLTASQALQSRQQAQVVMAAAGQQGALGANGSASSVWPSVSLGADLEHQAGSPCSVSITAAAVYAHDLSCHLATSAAAGSVQGRLQDLPGHVTRSAGTRSSSSSGASDSTTGTITTPADVGASLSALVQRLDAALHPSTVTPFVSLRNKYGVAHSPYGQGNMAYQRICAAASEPIGVGLTSAAHLHLPGPTPSAPVQQGTSAPAPTPTELQYVFEQERTGGTLAVLDAIQTWAEDAILQVRKQLSEEAQLQRELYQATGDSAAYTNISGLQAVGLQVQQPEIPRMMGNAVLDDTCAVLPSVSCGTQQQSGEGVHCQPAAEHSMQHAAQGAQPEGVSVAGPSSVSVGVQDSCTSSTGPALESTAVQTGNISTSQAGVQTSCLSTSQAGVQTSQVVTTCVAAQTHVAQLCDAGIQTSPPSSKQLSSTGVQAELPRQSCCKSAQTSPVSSLNTQQSPLSTVSALQPAGAGVAISAGEPPRSLFSLPGLCSATDVIIEAGSTAGSTAGCASSSTVAKVIAALNASSGPSPPAGLVRTAVAEPHKVAYKPAAFCAAAHPAAGLRASNARPLPASGYVSPVPRQHASFAPGDSNEMMQHTVTQHSPQLNTAQQELRQHQTGRGWQEVSAGVHQEEDVTAGSAASLQDCSSEIPEQCIWKELATEFAAATPASLQRSAAQLQRSADSYTAQSNAGTQDAALLAAAGACSRCWDGAAESPPTGALCFAASEASGDACEWADVAECDSVGVTRRDQRGAGDSASKALALSMKSLQEMVGSSPTRHDMRNEQGPYCSVDLTNGRDQHHHGQDQPYAEVQHSVEVYHASEHRVSEISAFASEGGLGSGGPKELLVGQQSMAGACKVSVPATLSGIQQQGQLGCAVPDSPPQPRVRFGCFGFVRRSRQ